MTDLLCLHLCSDGAMNSRMSVIVTLYVPTGRMRRSRLHNVNINQRSQEVFVITFFLHFFLYMWPFFMLSASARDNKFWRGRTALCERRFRIPYVDIGVVRANICRRLSRCEGGEANDERSLSAMPMTLTRESICEETRWRACIHSAEPFRHKRQFECN